MRFVIGLVVLLSSACSAFAECSPTLFRHTEIFSSSEVKNLSIAWSLSEEEYNTAKKEMGLSAYIYSVPVGANYGEFRSTIAKRVESLNLADFESRAMSYATSGLDANGLAAYKNCLLAAGGIELVAEQIGAANYKVSLVYYPSVFAKTDLKWELGKSPINLTHQNEMDLSSEISSTLSGVRVDKSFIIVPENPKAEVAFAVKLGDVGSKAILLPPLDVPRPPPPPPVPKVEPLRLASCKGQGGMQFVFWGPPGQVCNLAVWGKFKDNERTVTEIGSCTNPDFNGNQSTLFGPANEDCGGRPDWGKYHDARPISRDNFGFCVGQGGLASFVLWGPKGADCAGSSSPAWGTYN